MNLRKLYYAGKSVLLCFASVHIVILAIQSLRNGDARLFAPVSIFDLTFFTENPDTLNILNILGIIIFVTLFAVYYVRKNPDA